MGLPETLLALIRGLNALGRDIPSCKNTALGMGVWGFQTHPLMHDLAQAAVETTATVNTNPQQKALAERIAATPKLNDTDTETMETWHALVRQEDRSLLLRFLAVVLADSTKGLSWLGHCWQDMLFLGRPEIPKAALDMVQWDAITFPLKARLEAEWSFHCHQPEQALQAIESLDSDLWGLWRAYTGAEVLIRSGETEEAKEVLSNLWSMIPWHINLTLKLHALFNPIVMAADEKTNDAAILVYSWNKGELLAQTLKSLASSNLGQARIYALDNGSTDNTPEVLRQAQDIFGAERFQTITLPVNVGAPAARNWLLSLPAVRTAQWAAFLDDDVILPKDWLLHLLGAAQGDKKLGAVGCRITAATPPFGLQSADYNLFPTPPKKTAPGHLPNRVLLYDNCAGSTDTGLFSYTRPCLSVSGCCHLINMEAVRMAGGFDLRYTPSQFDDLDRDLRSALAGMPALYTGTMAIHHVQHSSLAKSKSVQQIGHVMGNKFKLDTRYTDEELLRLGAENRERLWDDLQTKHDFLAALLG